MPYADADKQRAYQLAWYKRQLAEDTDYADRQRAYKRRLRATDARYAELDRQWSREHRYRVALSDLGAGPFDGMRLKELG